MLKKQYKNIIHKKAVRDFYRILKEKLGSQGWWPTTRAGSALPQYFPGRSVKSLNEQEKFEVCLGAILTQNTSWSNVVRVIEGLNKKKSLGASALLKMPQPRLEQMLRSSGYFRQKSVRVKCFLKAVKENPSGKFAEFLRGSVEQLRQKLLSLNGIGPETADSMILYAAGKPQFVVDAYTRRIGERWGILKGKESYDAVQQVFMNSLPASADLFGEYHALLVELGKKYCQKIPDCFSCPVKKMCKEGKSSSKE